MAHTPQATSVVRIRLSLRTRFLVTTTICLVLAIFVAVIRYSQRKKYDVAQAELATLAYAMQIYYRDTGTFPENRDGINALFSPPPGLPDPSSWLGPYAGYHFPIDPWSHPFRYQRLDSTHFCLYSDGPDGMPDTDDDLAVTSSHFAEGPSVWERKEGT